VVSREAVRFDGEVSVAIAVAVASSPQRDRRILAVLVSGGLLYTVGQTLLLPSVGVISRGVHASHSSTTWVLTAYILSGAVAAPIVGRLGDMHGKRRTLLCLLATVSLGGLISALVPMVFGRLLTGVIAGSFPLGYAIIRDELPRRRVAIAIGLVSVSIGVGTGLGAIFAGIILKGFSYHWLYWFPLIGSVATGIAAWRWIPESPMRPGGRVDWVGAALMAVGLLMVLFAINEATNWGWGSARTDGLIGVGIVILLVWIAVERGRREPLIDMRTMALRSVWTTNLVATLFGFGMFAAFAIVPQFVEQPRSSGAGFGASIIVAGIFLLPSTVAMVTVSALAGRIEQRLGSRTPLGFGGAFSAAGFGLVAVLHSAPLDIYIGMALAGVGLGLGFAALPTLIVAAVPHEQTGAATAINTVARGLGGAIGVQICATTIALSIRASTGLPSNHGFTLAFAICAIGALGATLITFAIPRPMVRGA
jgi:MFS family permease